MSTRQAGKSTRQMAKKRHTAAVWIAIIGIAVVIGIGYISQNPETFGLTGAGVLFLFFLMWIIPKFMNRKIDTKIKEEKRAVRGARAEEKVGEMLEALPEEFITLHDVASPYGNIDHIVISKSGGVFLIETKAHGGRVEMNGDTLLVNGKLPEKDFIAQTLKNSYWLRDTLDPFAGAKPWITSILVFTNAFVSYTKPIKGVQIINKKYLFPALQKTNHPNEVNTRIWEQKVNIIEQLCSE